MQLATVYPGLQGVGFAARDEKRDQFPVVFLEPLDATNRLALGFDTMSEPRRRAAMERARDTGNAALSAKIVLVQDSRRGLQTAGFLMFLPVYSSPALPETVAERRATLRGFVYSPFRAEDFFRTTLADSGNDAFVEVFDGDSTSTATLLYRTGSSGAPDSMTETRRLPLAGHEWTVRLSVPATALSMTNSPIPWIVLGGVSTTLLLAGLAQALALSRQRLQERIRADRALVERERQAAQVLENALDAYVAIDAADRIVEWNRQAQTVFGWSAHEAIGRLLTETIIPADLRERHLAHSTARAAAFALGGIRGQPGRAAHCAGRPGVVEAGAHEPARQRAQVLAQRRSAAHPDRLRAPRRDAGVFRPRQRRRLRSAARG
jgi:PAS domain-containing protein